MLNKRENFIMATMNGIDYKIKMGMAVADKLFETYITDPSLLSNPINRELYPIIWGLQNSENTLPEGFGKEMLMDWIDDMEEVEYEEIHSFTQKCLGFYEVELNTKAEKMMNKAEETK